MFVFYLKKNFFASPFTPLTIIPDWRDSRTRRFNPRNFNRLLEAPHQHKLVFFFFFMTKVASIRVRFFRLRDRSLFFCSLIIMLASQKMPKIMPKKYTRIYIYRKSIHKFQKSSWCLLIDVCPLSFVGVHFFFFFSFSFSFVIQFIYLSISSLFPSLRNGCARIYACI